MADHDVGGAVGSMLGGAFQRLGRKDPATATGTPVPGAVAWDVTPLPTGDKTYQAIGDSAEGKTVLTVVVGADKVVKEVDVAVKGNVVKATADGVAIEKPDHSTQIVPAAEAPEAAALMKLGRAAVAGKTPPAVQPITFDAAAAEALGAIPTPPTPACPKPPTAPAAGHGGRH